MARSVGKATPQFRVRTEIERQHEASRIRHHQIESINDDWDWLQGVATQERSRKWHEADRKQIHQVEPNEQAVQFSNQLQRLMVCKPVDANDTKADHIGENAWK